MDEIHFELDSFTGGNIISFSANTVLMPATTLLSYIVYNLFENGPQLSLTILSKNISSALFPITKQIISDIENYDLQVQVLYTTDNYLNVILFKCFSPSATL
eukprot:TRINITY_DN26499_c0_g1_i1.p1 TRINITY_DN26499_c0_g1~~TRINITY_DN26499_c0_g1_i1.p1  ORF type:complete len:102 (+),score=4.62 TRINITY_DN26499_c0_g1_i1:87-392(+)